MHPTHLLMPITVEPSKFRMCHDERFLNLWIKDFRLSLDYLSNLPRYVGPGHYQTVCDDRSGYDHICLSSSSRTLFGLPLSFGSKASAYVCQVCWRLAILELLVHSAANTSMTVMQATFCAAFIVASVVTSLGYTLALSKSSLVPSQRVRFLGYLSDSLLLAFVLPEDIKLKFKAFRESILSQETVDLKTLQRFAGKTTSFCIGVLAARLYTRASFRAISSSSKSPPGFQ